MKPNCVLIMVVWLVLCCVKGIELTPFNERMCTICQMSNFKLLVSIEGCHCTCLLNKEIKLNCQNIESSVKSEDYAIELEEVTKLTMIRLPDDFIPKILKDVVKASRLTTIVITETNFTTAIARKVIFKNKNLERLEIRQCHLTTFNETAFMGVRNLQNLALDQIQLTKLPQGLNYLNKLTQLHVRFNNIKNLDGKLKLKQLAVFDAQSNQIKRVDKGFFEECETLKALHLDQNKIKVLDSRLCAPSLQLLMLNTNGITRFGDDFKFACNGLKKLYLQGNSLNMIPSHVFPESLAELDLSKNQVTINSFPRNAFENRLPTELNLNDNIFICSCELQWVKVNRVIIENATDIYSLKCKMESRNEVFWDTEFCPESTTDLLSQETTMATTELTISASSGSTTTVRIPSVATTERIPNSPTTERIPNLPTTERIPNSSTTEIFSSSSTTTERISNSPTTERFPSSSTATEKTLSSSTATEKTLSSSTATEKTPSLSTTEGISSFITTETTPNLATSTLISSEDTSGGTKTNSVTYVPTTQITDTTSAISLTVEELIKELEISVTLNDTSENVTFHWNGEKAAAISEFVTVKHEEIGGVSPMEVTVPSLAGYYSYQLPSNSMARITCLDLLKYEILDQNCVVSRASGIQSPKSPSTNDDSSNLITYALGFGSLVVLITGTIVAYQIKKKAKEKPPIFYPLHLTCHQHNHDAPDVPPRPESFSSASYISRAYTSGRSFTVVQCKERRLIEILRVTPRGLESGAPENDYLSLRGESVSVSSLKMQQPLDSISSAKNHTYETIPYYSRTSVWEVEREHQMRDLLQYVHPRQARTRNYLNKKKVGLGDYLIYDE